MARHALLHFCTYRWDFESNDSPESEKYSKFLDQQGLPAGLFCIFRLWGQALHYRCDQDCCEGWVWQELGNYQSLLQSFQQTVPLFIWSGCLALGLGIFSRLAWESVSTWSCRPFSSNSVGILDERGRFLVICGCFDVLWGAARQMV